MFKAIIFDMDGVMFDTEKLFVKCGIEVGRRIGYNIDSKIIIKCMGSNYNKIREIFFEELGDSFPFDLFYKEYLKVREDFIKKNGIDVKKGVYELLNYLYINKYKIAIASSNDRDIIRNYLELAGINENIFDVIMGGDGFINGKPMPDIYLETCRLLGIDSGETMVIEDSNNGIKASYLAGCFTVFIPDISVVDDNNLYMINKKMDSLLDVIEYLDKNNNNLKQNKNSNL